MSKYKVVCNRGDYAYTFNQKTDAVTAANNHKRRTRHSPVFIYEVADDTDLTRDELLAHQTPDPTLGILQIFPV